MYKTFLFLGIMWVFGVFVSTGEAKVSPEVLYNHVGEALVDYLDFVEEFGRIFKMKDIGGNKRRYALGLIGDNTTNSIEVCYRLCDNEPAPLDNPGSVIGTICEIRLPFKNREEMRKAVKYAHEASFFTLRIYDLYQELPVFSADKFFTTWRKK